MRYFKNSDNQIFAYDLTQTEYIEKAEQTMVDITEDYTRLKTQDEIDSSIQVSISDFALEKLNEVALSWRYNDIYDAISYKDSTNERFAAEAQVLLAYRDQVKSWSMQLPAIITLKDLKIAQQSFPSEPDRPV